VVRHIARYCGNAGNKAHPGGQKQPNKLGLYDMAGSVSEWVDDWYIEDLGSAPRINPWQGAKGKVDEKVLRGGEWTSPPARLRAAYRNHWSPTSTSTGYRNFGFRCVRTLKVPCK